MPLHLLYSSRSAPRRHRASRRRQAVAPSSQCTTHGLLRVGLCCQALTAVKPQGSAAPPGLFFHRCDLAGAGLHRSFPGPINRPSSTTPPQSSSTSTPAPTSAVSPAAHRRLLRPIPPPMSAVSSEISSAPMAELSSLPVGLALVPFPRHHALPALRESGQSRCPWSWRDPTPFPCFASGPPAHGWPASCVGPGQCWTRGNSGPCQLP
jgi:hypothetical protein